MTPPTAAPVAPSADTAPSAEPPVLLPAAPTDAPPVPDVGWPSAYEVRSERRSFLQAYLDELACLRPDVFARQAGAAWVLPSIQVADDEPQAPRVARVYHDVATSLTRWGSPAEAPLSALCLSGGGIRSATFSLGVLQALASVQALHRFDYLSTVSGGGYIGGWLTAWIARDRRRAELDRRTPSDRSPQAEASATAPIAGSAMRVERALAGGRQAREDANGYPNPFAPEAEPVGRLREYSNYLTPRSGLMSADTWAVAATVVRNLLLNWLVVLPVLGAVLALPQLAYLVVHDRAAVEYGGRFGPDDPSTLVGLALAAAAIAVGAWSSLRVHRERRNGLNGVQARDNTAQVFRRSVIPLFLAAGLLSSAGVFVPWRSIPDRLTLWGVGIPSVVPVALVWCFLIPLVGWVASAPDARRRRRSSEFWALAWSGAVGAGGLLLLAHYRMSVLQRPALYIIAAFPALLLDYLISRTLFVAVASRREDATLADAAKKATGEREFREIARDRVRDELDREWWARFSGFVLLAALAWAVLSAVVLLGPYAVQHYLPMWGARIVAAFGGVFGVAAALLGNSGSTPSGRAKSDQGTSLRRDQLLGVLAAAALVLVAVALAAGTATLGRLSTGEPTLLCVPNSLRVDARCTPPHAGESSQSPADVCIRSTTSPNVAPLAPADSCPPASTWARQAIGSGSSPRTNRAPPWNYLGWLPLGFFVVPVGLAAVGVLASLVVSANRFSLHGFYRNRLVRAYLGASFPERPREAAAKGPGGQPGEQLGMLRKLFSRLGRQPSEQPDAQSGAENPRWRDPDPFTGFDVDDDLRLHQVWDAAARRERWRRLAAGTDAHADPAPVITAAPMPLLNAALNLADGGGHLAWQQRKAESFAMTPLYCGNHHEGYRDSRAYGGPTGIALGTAMTVSGAAANPNMGYNASPVVTFVMGLFNARLGAWMANPNEHGPKAGAPPAPRGTLAALFDELFARTRRTGRYVNLSDGGHFDNLGLYEAVLRRCRLIVVVDASCDPAHGYADLGNATRKIRIDLGIPVVFPRGLDLRPRTDAAPDAPDGEGHAVAVGRVLYSVVDDAEPRADGWLLYLKPTLRSRVGLPMSVRSYAAQSGTFPHETTADQWFDESQFESYRALGRALGRHVFGQVAVRSMSDLVRRARAAT